LDTNISLKFDKLLKYSWDIMNINVFFGDQNAVCYSYFMFLPLCCTRCHKTRNSGILLTFL